MSGIPLLFTWSEHDVKGKCWAGVSSEVRASQSEKHGNKGLNKQREVLRGRELGGGRCTCTGWDQQIVRSLTPLCNPKYRFLSSTINTKLQTEIGLPGPTDLTHSSSRRGKLQAVVRTNWDIVEGPGKLLLVGVRDFADLRADRRIFSNFRVNRSLISVHF